MLVPLTCFLGLGTGTALRARVVLKHLSIFGVLIPENLTTVARTAVPLEQ